MIDVEVACATAQKQRILALRVATGTTAWQAVLASGISGEFPELEISNSPMGIGGERLDGKQRPLPGEYVLQAGDRVDIYRPLTINPRQARLARAATATADGS